MEYADLGDLQNKINSNTNSKLSFPEQEIWKAAIDLTKGLTILHKMSILHRDLKSANIFITKTPKGIVYKIGDLNVAKIAKKDGFVYTQTGTPYYASPEVWRDEPYDNKSDIWSLGCVLYEMCALKPPFMANDMEGLFNKVQMGLYERIPQKYSNDLSCFLSSLLKVNPQQRPSCEQIMRNPLFQKYQNQQEITKQITNHTCQKQELLQTIIVPKNLGQLKGSRHPIRIQSIPIVNNILINNKRVSGKV
ncbi:protein kinase domain protein [Ichthyophthirius multifiliis]|uniref:non-specific serine/threonine protein kinase n=1 Tax=Ichthyophthirius multifiliis TaxID=5932 RepID=G0QPE4_ICHMU|nr:protein kinase domain protein [Ichthyophthirius multifiliis]EGR32912.1 protein kinase domain protein [Ichthyophthirius multifiliis]|eukprot:XP_004036898.1 protein kinase domain protein [Ichthyophthirius multifiliis]